MFDLGLPLLQRNEGGGNEAWERNTLQPDVLESASRARDAGDEGVWRTKSVSSIPRRHTLERNARARAREREREREGGSEREKQYPTVPRRRTSFLTLLFSIISLNT